MSSRTPSGEETSAPDNRVDFDNSSHLVTLRVCSHLYYWWNAARLCGRLPRQNVRFQARGFHSRPRSESSVTLVTVNASRLIFNLVKYIALLAMTKIVPTHAYLIAEYQDTILQSVNDQDISIRMRALDLVSAMVRTFHDWRLGINLGFVHRSIKATCSQLSNNF